MSDPSPAIARARVILLDVWRDLSMAQQSALRRATSCTGSYRLQFDTPAHTGRALAAKGLVLFDGDARVLTPLGIMLRSIGMEADAVAARRRFSKRKNPAEKAVGRA
jgi:hypothetical protein